jgi:hypothetical protein
MALLHESKILRYNPPLSGNCAAIIRNLAFYYHWIPDIFPEIQEKFRHDSGISYSCNKAIPDIFPDIQEKFRDDKSPRPDNDRTIALARHAHKDELSAQLYHQ